ncbi:MAG: hypothetical protein GX639_11495 [Fibrobacter sp.]|nr:hypothetical protein [Fibrobacter sp.]
MIASGGKNRDAVDNYVYDANGNIIEDKALRTKTEYDYRNLPVKVTTYANAEMTEVNTVLRYIYDADGNRVVKVREQ